MQHSSPRKTLPLLTLFAISFFACVHAHAQTQAPEQPGTRTTSVTAAQYADFLNQNTASDPDHLFDEKMASDSESACIIRFGRPEKFHYEVIAGRENFPVPYINEVRAAAYAAAMNLEQESHHEDFFLASNQNSFSVAINNPLGELSLRISHLSSDSHYLESGSTMAIIGTLGMIVMGMVGREELVHEPVHEAPSRNILTEPTSPHYGGRMDNVRPTTGNTPPIITETEKQLPANERTMGSFQGTSVTVPETRSLEARGLTEDERAEQERAFWQSERDEREIRYREHSSANDLKISADDAPVSKNTGVSVSVSSQDIQQDSTPLITSSVLAPRNIYRFKGGKWEQKTSNGSWEPTDRFQLDNHSKIWKTAEKFSQENADMLLKVTDRFIDNYNGLEGMNQKRNRLEHELAEEQKQPSPNEKKCESLSARIKLLEDAVKKEAERIKKLASPPAKSIPEQISDSIDRLHRAEETSSIAYNRFELEELALDFRQQIRTDNKVSPELKLYLCLAHINFYKAAAEAKKDSPNQQVIDWFTGNAEVYQQAATEFVAGQGVKAVHLYDAASRVYEAAEEAQQFQPNQQVIDWSTRGNELYQQTVIAIDEEQPDKASHLLDAGLSLHSAATEALEDSPNQQVIEWFTRSAELYQQAITALDEGQTDKAGHLADAGDTLYRAALEALEDSPNQQVIDCFTRAAQLDQQAATALDEGQRDKARHLADTAYRLRRAAEEAQQLQPNQQSIDSF